MPVPVATKCADLRKPCVGAYTGYLSSNTCPPLIVLAVLCSMSPLVMISNPHLAVGNPAGATR